MTCPYCKKFIRRKKDAINHVNKYHADRLEADHMDAAQALYYEAHGRLYGYCVCGCGKKTEWNYKTGKPYRVSNDPKCRERLHTIAQANLMRVRGVNQHTLMSDMVHQRELMERRKISGVYMFQDGGKVEYMGQLEKKWLQFCDLIMDFTSNMIQEPPEDFPYYDPQAQKTRIYIPDYYLPDYNLMVEIKDGGSHPNGNPAFLKETRYKVALKDEAMRKQNKYNYIRISGTNYGPFLEALYQITHEQEPDEDDKKKNVVVVISEAASSDALDFPSSTYLVDQERIDPKNISFVVGVNTDTSLCNCFAITDLKSRSAWYVNDRMDESIFYRWQNPYLYLNTTYTLYKYIGDAEAMSEVYRTIVSYAETDANPSKKSFLELFRDYGIMFSDGTIRNNDTNWSDFIRCGVMDTNLVRHDAVDNQ